LGDIFWVVGVLGLVVRIVKGLRWEIFLFIIGTVFENIGAGDEIRTHDIYLGKVTLYP
jgi:hypothetical protein